MNLNKTFVLGRVTREPEIRSLPSGQQVANFGMATNRYYTDSSGQKQEAVEFHNIVAFGKTADIISRYVNKGTLLLIEGRMQTRNWTNQQGAKQYKTEIVAESMQLGPKSAGGMSNSNYTKSNSGDNSDTDKSNSQPDIPVIEENYGPPSVEAGPPAQSVSFEDKPTDEIDVKKIPF